ncbi:MAG: ribbon-helix-helix protein, CopG family [Blastocatellia bacterium]
MKTIAITIDEHVLERVDRFVDAAESLRRNRSQVIRQAVEEYLERLERMMEEEREQEIFRAHRQKLELQAEALVREQANI